MGTWDAGPFDNDDAADFIGDLDSAPENERAAMIRSALLAAAENDTYLDLGTGAPAVAAAALLASHLPGGEEFTHSRYGAQAPIPNLAPDLAPLAINALDRIQADGSELRALWAEDARAERPWHSSMQRLSLVLAGSAA